MVPRVELRQEDLLAAAGIQPPGAAVEAEEGGVSDLVTTIREFNLELQTSMDKFMDMLRLVATLRGGGVPGMMPGAIPASVPVQHPSPGAAGQDPKAQILAALEQIQAQAGDVTLLELFNLVMQQYGGLHLSQIIALVK